MSNECTPAFNQRPKINDLLVDIPFVKQNFLFGVNLKDDSGNELPDSVFEFYIRSAQEYIQRELQILLKPTVITEEAHDYHFDDYTDYGRVKLLHFPVRKVCKYSIKFPVSDTVLDFDPSWFKIDSIGGTVNLIPTSGTISQTLVASSGAYLHRLYGRDYVPYIIFVDYEAGFEEGEIPSDILEVIGMQAALGPLNIAGDMVIGAGIANKSISLDGLSESIGTTASATFSAYSARITTYQKAIKEMLTTIRLNYKGIQFTVV